MAKTRSPSTNGANRKGRDARGRFTAGNSGGPGNPYISKVASWRWAIANAVTDDDIDAAIRQLVSRAREGDLPAIQSLLDRCVGKPASFEMLELQEHIDRIEERIRNAANSPETQRS